MKKTLCALALAAATASSAAQTLSLQVSDKNISTKGSIRSELPTLDTKLVLGNPATQGPFAYGWFQNTLEDGTTQLASAGTGYTLTNTVAKLTLEAFGYQIYSKPGSVDLSAAVTFNLPLSPSIKYIHTEGASSGEMMHFSLSHTIPTKAFDIRLTGRVTYNHLTFYEESGFSHAQGEFALSRKISDRVKVELGVLGQKAISDKFKDAAEGFLRVSYSFK